MAEKTTDSSGKTSISTGKGTLVVWATKDHLVSTALVKMDKAQTLTLKLKSDRLPKSIEWDLVPPPVSKQRPAVNEQQRAENNRRLAQEDSIRQAYEATMPVEEWRGNHANISQFLAEARNKTMALKLLEVISKKDLRDIPLEVLRDNETANVDTTDIYCRYVLSPRVENEWLTPYKHFFRSQLKDIGSPETLVEWCRQHITIDETGNPQHLRMEPMSTYRTRKTDALGRNIFFVAAARSLGWPARVNEVNGSLQYFKDREWVDVVFEAPETAASAQPKGRLKLLYTPTRNDYDPKYYIHFTLSKIANGRLQLLTYPEEATYQHGFSDFIELEAGDYLLTCGTRLASGKVLSQARQFTISEGESLQLPFAMRADKQDVQVIGSLNAELIYHDQASQADKSLLSTTGRGYYVVAIVAPNNEPTNHALRDISAYKDEFERWGRKMVLLFEGNDMQRFNFAEFGQLPNTVVWGTDKEGKIIDEMVENMHLGSRQQPIFMICDTFNRVVFVQQGYTINLGEQLLKVIRKLN